MNRTRLEQREDMKRFSISNSARASYKVSKNDLAKKAARDRILLINEAKDLGCNLEDLM